MNYKPIIKKDSAIIATSGIYSDQTIDGLYTALQDIDLNVELVEYEKEHPLALDYIYHQKMVWKDNKILEFLVGKKLMKKQNYNELWIGEYSWNVTPDTVKVYEHN